MKVNQSLTAAITAAALVAGAGFAYAQTQPTADPQVTNTPDASSAQGPIMQNQGTNPTTPGSTMDNSNNMQTQPSSPSSSFDNNTTTTLEPRADRN
jgi:cell division protein FtsN